MKATRERKHDRASMRPAQKAPENASGRTARAKAHGCFNEAGAKSAGKPYGLLIHAFETLMLQ